MQTIKIEMSDLMYDSLTNFIEGSQYHSTENYILSLLRTAVPLKAQPNKSVGMVKVEELRNGDSRATENTNIDKLLNLMKQYNVLQKDLAASLGVSVPAINVQLKNTNAHAKTKLRKAIQKNGVEGVLVSAFLGTCCRTGVEYFQTFLADDVIPFELDNNLAHISYGYCVIFLNEAVIDAFKFYKTFIRLYDKSALNCDGKMEEVKKSLEEIILNIYKENSEDKNSSISFKQ